MFYISVGVFFQVWYFSVLPISTISTGAAHSVVEI